MRVCWLVLAGLASCSFRHGELTDGGGVLETDALDLPPGQHWIFESASDFGAPGSGTTAVTIEPRGSLTLDGYLYGGLVMYGKQGTQLWSTTTQTFDFASTATVTPDGVALWDTEYSNVPGTSFANAGVTDTSVKFSLWFEGEIYLDADDLLTLDADGAGFVDLRAPGGVWTQLLVGKSDGTHSTTTPIATAGWYEVRIGYGEGTNLGHLDFRRGPSGTATHFERHRMRAAASKLRGTMREVFAHQILGGAQADGDLPVPSLQATDFIAAQTFPTPLLGTTTTDDWSARWFGQFYAPTAGAYSLQVTSDDGHQGVFGAAKLSSHWGRDDNTAAAMSTTQATLEVGWHDVTLDYNQTAGGRALTVQLSEAPDAALVGMPLPLASLRPVEPRGDRLISGTRKFTAVTVANNTTTGAAVQLALDGFTSEVVTSLDATFHVTTDHLDQLVFAAVRPNGTRTAMATHPTGGAFSGYFQVTSNAAGLVGAAPTGMWSVGIADNTSGANNTTFDEVYLTVHTSGGPEQIALAGTWVSPVKDAGTSPVHIVDVTWSERAATPSQVFLRACTMADCSDDPAWGNPVALHATMDVANRYLQVKVAMTSDGTTEPALDALAVTYSNP